MQEKPLKLLWDEWFIYCSDGTGKFKRKEFDMFSRLQKYFMYLPCKNTTGAFTPFALYFQKLTFGTTMLITSVTNFIYGWIKYVFATIDLIEIFTSSYF